MADAAGATGISDAANSQRARAIARAVEPFAAQVYFAPECHQRYEALGFGPSPGTDRSGVALPEGPAYFCSRGSALGQAPGWVVAAAFGVFKAEVVVDAVTAGWAITDAPTIAQARHDGAVAHLRRLLGERPEGVERALVLLERAAAPLRPEGRPLFAGLRARPRTGDPLADAWLVADLLREYRGDVHTAAWTTAGFDAAEIGLLTEAHLGLRPRSYVRTRGWGDAELDAARSRLEASTFLDGEAITESGRLARRAVEQVTDRGCRPLVEALGDDHEELVALLTPWGDAIRAGSGYPAT